MAGPVRPVIVAAVAAVAAIGCRIEEHPPERRLSHADSVRIADSAAVVAIIRMYYRDFSARDWAAFASHFWQGADLTTVFPPPGDSVPRVVVMPVSEFVDAAPDGPGSREIFQELPETIEVSVRNELALVWVRYSARFGDPGDLLEWSGTDAFTLMRHEGVWKIVEIAFAADAAGPES